MESTASVIGALLGMIASIAVFYILFTLII
jgi:hypothetical protein